MSDEQTAHDRQGSGQAAPDRSQSSPQASSPAATTSGSGASAPAPNNQQETSKPKIGDSRPAPVTATERQAGSNNGGRRRRGSGGGRGNADDKAQGQSSNQKSDDSRDGTNQEGGGQKRRRRRGGRGRGAGSGGGAGSNNGGGGNNRNSPEPVTALTGDAVELDEETLALRKGRERKGKPAGRYLMCVSVRDQATQIAVLEGRNLIEHYVSRPADDVAQIHGNIYLGKVQNVLPGMEAAFVDIATPKNAVLYRGDVQAKGSDNRSTKIEQLLKPKSNILCQVTKNPIAHKGARLTQEVSLPGRFVVLVPNSDTYGISKRLPERERKRLRKILDRVKPKGAGIIVRTAAENVTEDEIVNDVSRLADQWDAIEKLANKSQTPTLLYREPEMAVRVIREEFNKDYRGIVIDDRALYEDVKSYVESITPALADRVEYYDRDAEPLSLFERHHVSDQLRKAVDPKVWLPSGGSLIIESTEALTVIDVNTGKNVGKSSLEETVYRNNLEAAREVARQLRLRDIGGIIVIDFVDMEIKKNRDEVVRVFREALAQDKTRTQVFEISELGLVEMTRKRIGEGLVESLSSLCETCEGPGHVLEKDLLEI
ncbi:MAG: Rne/Rng family ribonuclease [Acidimicrobiia bacterium]|nr:Rne/Rng family ribonuclease [Acidimicrobiia bacterium]